MDKLDIGFNYLNKNKTKLGLFYIFKYYRFDLDNKLFYRLYLNYHILINNKFRYYLKKYAPKLYYFYDIKYYVKYKLDDDPLDILNKIDYIFLILFKKNEI